jgi:hypothetical protein
LQVEVQFTELQEYKDCWPVIDLVKARLKCTSERARRLAALTLGINGKAAVKGKGRGKEKET